MQMLSQPKKERVWPNLSLSQVRLHRIRLCISFVSAQPVISWSKTCIGYIRHITITDMTKFLLFLSQLRLWLKCDCKHIYIFLNKQRHLQGELLSLSSQLSTLPRRADDEPRLGVVSWEKYFPIIPTTLSSSDKTGTPCPKSRAVVYTILILVFEAPGCPPNV